MGIVNGMTRAANALRYWELRQQSVANNLANADTNGFKAERTFAQLVGDALTVAGSATDLKAGSLKGTGNPLDLAIGGKGFFVVQTPQGERLTRAGSFQLDATGKLVDDHGNAVLGEKGPIVVDKGTLVVDPSGAIKVDGKEVGRLRVESVPEGAQLTHAGATMFLPPAGTTSVPPSERGLKQGFLEESNVSTVGSMVDMIDIQRAYTSVQRTVTTLDDVRKTISNELGRV
ncbi:MAG TPA: flagellar hook-basal body complex protein [Longimicrobiaceae bacterium]|nr:flagellar hook-basal body complex protein [Longimicrobiaceae bacterium]